MRLEAPSGIQYTLRSLISFTIPGKPKALKRHRVSKNGGMYDPSSKDKRDIWLQIAKFKPKQPLSGNILLSISFTMPRPKNHFRTGRRSHVLKAKAPYDHIKRPDLDNLVKMVADVIQGKDRFIADDSMICTLYAEKHYDRRPKTEVIIDLL